MKSCICTTTSW